MSSREKLVRGVRRHRVDRRDRRARDRDRRRRTYATSDQEADRTKPRRKLEARLTDKADQLAAGLVGDIKQTAAAQNEAKKAGK